jgi:hypothetical protein
MRCSLRTPTLSMGIRHDGIGPHNRACLRPTWPRGLSGQLAGHAQREKSLLVRLRRPRPAVHQIIDDRRCRIAACFGAIIILVAGDGAIDRRGAKA